VIGRLPGTRSQAGATDGDLDQVGRKQAVRAAQQQGVDGVGGGLGRLPILGLFLLEQPDLEFLDGGGAAATSSKASIIRAWVSIGARYHHQLKPRYRARNGPAHRP
jgi:hypothetical protein